MLDLYYKLPTVVAVVVVFLLISLLALGIKKAIGHFTKREADQHEFETSINLMQVVAAYIGIVIALAGVQAWQNYSDAQNAVAREATTTRELYRDLASYGLATQPVRVSIRGYVKSVIEDEYPLLKIGASSEKTDKALDGIFHQFSRLNPAGEREGTVYAEAFSKLNDLVSFRRDRIISSRSNIPGIILFISLSGAVLTLAYTGAIKPTRYNRIYSLGLDFIMALLFVFILNFNNPYKRDGEIDFGEITALSAAFDDFDTIYGQP